VRSYQIQAYRERVELKYGPKQKRNRGGRNTNHDATGSHLEDRGFNQLARQPGLMPALG
jgi:hypothetical protein